jgi:hypothetical protein
MKSQHLSLGLTAILVTSAVAIGGFRGEPSPVRTSTETVRSQVPGVEQSQATTEPQDQSSLPAQTPDVPKHVVYGILFREMSAFRKKAEELRVQGKDARVLENFHAKRANLNEAQTTALENIAQESQSEIEEIEQEANRIIEKGRALHPDGKLQPGETLPKPPKQLQALEQRRQAALIKGREKVRAAMGDSEFQRFEEFQERDIAERAKPVKRPPHSIKPLNPGSKQKP